MAGLVTLEAIQAYAIEKRSRVAAAVRVIASFEIRDDATNTAALLYTKEIKAEAKAIKAKLATFIDPLLSVVDALKAEVKPHLDALKEIEDALKAKALQYQRDVAAREASARIEASRLLAANAPAVEVRAALDVRDTHVVTPVAGVSFGARWVGRVVDLSLVPREFFDLNQERVNRVMRESAGQAKIPGIEAEDVGTMRVRS